MTTTKVSMRKHLGKMTVGFSSAVALAVLTQQAVSADSYTVQAGDSFYSIATQHGMSPYDLAAKNGKTIYDTILPGDTLQVDGASQTQTAVAAPATETAASDLVSDTEDVVLNTPTATGNSYPIGQCTWGVKELAPWASNWWGNAKSWTANAAASGFSTGTIPVVGAIAVWDGGEYGHVAYVTDVASERSIQVLESNYNRNKAINNYRGWFDPTTFYGRVTYIYPY